MKKILTTTVFFVFLGLLVFSFVTCKHSSGSSDDDLYVGDEDDQGGDGSGNVEERRPLTKEEVETLLNEGISESDPVRYRQLWNSEGTLWGEFKFYYENSTLVYEFDNSAGSGDQEKGEVKINDDASVTVTAKYWWYITDGKGEWSETNQGDNMEATHKSTNHKYCGFILQFYSDNTAEVYEWLVKDDTYKTYIPDSFPTESYVEPSGSDNTNANVVCECITADGNYYKKQ